VTQTKAGSRVTAHWEPTYRNEYRMLHNESPAPYEGRHRVPESEYWHRLADGLIRDTASPHNPRHSADFREVQA
jgi:hypothetical protein